MRARTGSRAGLYARHGARPAAPRRRWRRCACSSAAKTGFGAVDRRAGRAGPYGLVRPRDKGWRPYLTQEQVASVARGLWLHRMAGSAAEADRFACEYGVVHSPARGSGEGPPAARRGAGSSGRVWLAGRGRC
ncbi:DUF6417 family protein [Streptomyces mirabilis]|uniref:DUF6417 family protein n=1 Tax=Streptomyces mirabilis TaxID=68239 RepID=UPI0033261EB4